nr:olfactory receptor 56-like [Manis javanica]
MAWVGNQTLISQFILLGLFTGSPLHLLLFCTIVLMFLVALSGNGLMLLLINTDPRLHSPMYFFLSWLSLMDLMLVCTIVPRMATDFLLGRGSISFTGCGIQILFFLTLLGDECFLLAFMAYDRYVAISNPLRYSVVMGRRVCWLMVAGSWLFGLVDGLIQAVFTLRFPYCGSQEIDHFFCEVPAILKLACADTSLYETMIYVCCVLMLLLPFSVISASYLRILVVVLRMSSAEGRRKALATCSSHMAVVSLFYGAAMITYMRPQAYHSSKQDKVVSAFYTMVTPMLNPLIYSLRNKEVAGALKKLLGRLGASARMAGSTGVHRIKARSLHLTAAGRASS